MKRKILLLENISSKAVDIFKNEGYDVECKTNITLQELKEKIKDIDVIGIRSKTNLNQDLLERSEKLLCIGSFCIGTDGVDLEKATSLGIPVFNSPYANSRSVAELVIGEMICLARQVFVKSRECHTGIWNKTSKDCFELRGKSLGIVGYGHVGSQLSVLAESFGMNIFYYDIIPVMSLGNAKKINSLDELLTKVDFLSLHVPKTPQTVNMIGGREIDLMKKGSFIINASRGDVVETYPVSIALRNKKLAGCAFDVFPNEPHSGEEFVSELQHCPNTILTPHIGGSTQEAQDNIGVEVANKIVNFLKRGSTIGSVNFPEIDLKTHNSSNKLINIHHNLPGVMADINGILSEYNILGQVLGTNEEIGCMIVEIDKKISENISNRLNQLKYNIKTRIL